MARFIIGCICLLLGLAFAVLLVFMYVKADKEEKESLFSYIFFHAWELLQLTFALLALGLVFMVQGAQRLW